MSDQSSIDAAWGDLLGNDDDPATPAPLTPPTVDPDLDLDRDPTAGEAPSMQLQLEALDSTDEGEVPSSLPAVPSLHEALEGVMSQIDSDSGLLRIPAPSDDDLPAGPARMDGPDPTPDAEPDGPAPAPGTDVDDRDETGSAEHRLLPPAKDRTTGPRPVVQRSPDPELAAGVPTWAYAAAAAVAVAVTAWVLTRDPGDEGPAASSSGAAVAKVEPPPPSAAVATRTEVPPSDTHVAAAPPTTPPTTAPTTPVARPEPSEHPPAVDDPVAVAAGPAWTPDPAAAARYDAAKTRYADSRSNEDLAAMVVAACEMDDGPKARVAYRGLKGPQLREQIRSDCADSPVDLRADSLEYTEDELARQAERALAAGDTEAAMKLARASNKLQRNKDALALIVRIACADADADTAVKMLRHVADDDREPLRRDCAARGVTLPVED